MWGGWGEHVYVTTVPEEGQWSVIQSNPLELELGAFVSHVPWCWVLTWVTYKNSVCLISLSHLFSLSGSLSLSLFALTVWTFSLLGCLPPYFSNNILIFKINFEGECWKLNQSFHAC